MKARGFTLIELLVVIAIIGILSAVTLTALNVARAKSRDARRLADLKELRTALQFYATDNNGNYPTTGGSWFGNCSGWGSYGTTGASGWIPALAPTYIKVLPLDPQPNGASGCYLYSSNGREYKVLAYTTVETYTAANNPMADANHANSFAVYSAGGAAF